jgi:hypothetical protein
MVVLAEKKAWSPTKSVHTGSSKTGFVYVLGLMDSTYACSGPGNHHGALCCSSAQSRVCVLRPAVCEGEGSRASEAKRRRVTDEEASANEPAREASCGRIAHRRGRRYIFQLAAKRRNPLLYRVKQRISQPVQLRTIRRTAPTAASAADVTTTQLIELCWLCWRAQCRAGFSF